jgi:hypothetical protein
MIAGILQTGIVQMTLSFNLVVLHHLKPLPKEVGLFMLAVGKSAMAKSNPLQKAYLVAPTALTQKRYRQMRGTQHLS